MYVYNENYKSYIFKGKFMHTMCLLANQVDLPTRLTFVLYYLTVFKNPCQGNINRRCRKQICFDDLKK